MGFLQPPSINWSQDDLNFLQGASDFNGVWEPGEFNGPLPDMEPDLRDEAVAGDYLFWSRHLDNMISDKKRMTIQGLVDLVAGAIVIPSGLPDGGTTGQALIKASNDDQDVEWGDMPEGFSGAYGDLTGVPSTFAPSAHTHPFTEVTGLTKGSVPFAGPTGILAQDNQNFFFDDEGDNFFVSSALGSEIILNGIFASGASWTAPSGWTIASGVATHGSNGTGALTPSTAITIYAGMRYTITIDISAWTVGTATIAVGGVTIAVASANGTYTKHFTATATTNLTITPSNTARFSVDNVSLKQLTGGKISSGNFYGALFQSTITGLGATTSPGSVLDNPTPATAGVQQASPSNLLRGRGYNSSGSASWPFEIQDYAIGNVNITAHGKWIQQWRGNSGTWAEFCSFDSDPLGKGFNLTPGQSHSNGNPGTTRVLTLSNTGSHTWIDFLFSGVRKSHIGADSNGAMKFYAGGGSYFEYYQMASGSLFSYNYPSAFYHSGSLQAAGHGMFGGKVGAGTGSGTTPTSTLTVNGGEAKKTRRVTTNTTLDDTAYFWIVDASTPSCNGTPSVTTCSTYTGSGQAVCEAHLPCSWYGGSSCAEWNGNQSECDGHSGCTYETASCSGFGDESTCTSYGCSWSGTDCSPLNESECGTYSGSGCTVNTSDCSAFNGNESGCSGQSGCSVSSSNTCSSQGDESSCVSAGCSWDGMSCTGDNSTCSGSYFTGCTGTYYSCTGTYYSGNCSGTYGAACSGTATCSGYASSGACTGEAGCSWVTAATITLPDSAVLPNYSCAIYNGSSTGADVNIVAPAGHTVDVSVLSAYKDSVILQGFNDARQCSDFSSAGACTPTGCTPSYNSCSWESMDNTCYGDASCSAANGTDSMTCNAISYFSSCSGTWYASKHYYRLAS